MKKIIKSSIIILLMMILTMLLKWSNSVAADNETYVAKTYIDNPTNGSIENGTINLKGWVMSNDTESKIRAYIDGKEQTIEGIAREERKDVIEAIKGYGTETNNPTPGFTGTINIKNLSKGTHNLTIKIFSREDKLLAEHARTFNIEKYIAKMYVDSVGDSNTLKVGSVIRGWAMSNDKDITFKVYIDEKEQNIEKINKEKREDVLNAIHGYGDRNQNPIPGFQMKLDIKQITDGTHKLKMQVVSRNGEILTEWCQDFSVKKYEARMYIDDPTEQKTVNKNLNIIGWIMTNDKNSNVKVYIDDVEQQIQSTKRLTRSDVIKAINGYGGIEYNPTPGFNMQINVADNIKDGQHKLKIEVFSQDKKLLTSATRQINIKKYDGKMYIDNPTQNSRVKKNIYVRGWKMTDDKNAEIKIYIDNKEQKNLTISKEERDDVLKAIQGYGGKTKNPYPGFVTNIDVSSLLDGKHTLKIDVVSSLGEIITTETKNIVVKKYDTKICIDSPQEKYTSENSVYLRGWVMSELKNKKIIVKINGNTVENVKAEERPDVLNTIKNYGGEQNNEVPGFNAQIDLSGYEKGEHTITVEVYSNDMNETIESVQIKVTNKKQIVQETGSYGISGIWIKGQIRRV